MMIIYLPRHNVTRLELARVSAEHAATLMNEPFLSRCFVLRFLTCLFIFLRLFRLKFVLFSYCCSSRCGKTLISRFFYRKLTRTLLLLLSSSSSSFATFVAAKVWHNLIHENLYIVNHWATARGSDKNEIIHQIYVYEYWARRNKTIDIRS